MTTPHTSVPTTKIELDGGTILVSTSLAEAVPRAVWDPRAEQWRLPAYLYGELAAVADAEDVKLEGDLRDSWAPVARPYDALGLRTYQEEALNAWRDAGMRGVIALPTGAGKTRVALAAILSCGVPTVVLCPTRALLSLWASELGAALGERIGIVGDGERTVERVTVMTFESAYRRMDTVGGRFGLLVVDEAHHFGSGARAEALEACAATMRLGLSATAPSPGSDGAHRLMDLIGRVVIEVSVAELTGTHLADLTMVHVPVDLDEQERIRYETLSQPFTALRRLYFRRHWGTRYEDMLKAVGATPEGRAALRDHAAAVQLACFPKAKRALISSLLRRHRTDRTIIFTSRVEDAYHVAEHDLVAVITGEVGTRERTRILEKFKDGRLRAVASARVLNEGIDVPDARVAIVASGSLGAREHVQRIGRVLRPAPGKRAIVYELVTRNTVDERLAKSRSAAAASRRAPAMNDELANEMDENDDGGFDAAAP